MTILKLGHALLVNLFGLPDAFSQPARHVDGRDISGTWISACSTSLREVASSVWPSAGLSCSTGHRAHTVFRSFFFLFLRLSVYCCSLYLDAAQMLYLSVALLMSNSDKFHSILCFVLKPKEEDEKQMHCLSQTSGYIKHC